MIPRPSWYVKGRYYELTRVRHPAGSSVAIPVGVISTTKVVVFDTITITRVACYPSTASGAGVRVQTGFYAIDPFVGHAIGAPLGQTGPFAPVLTNPLQTVPLLAPLTLQPGAYRRAVAVSAAAGSFLGDTNLGSPDDQGNALAALNKAWTWPWTYSAAGLPTLTAGLAWTASPSLPTLLALVT